MSCVRSLSKRIRIFQTILGFFQSEGIFLRNRDLSQESKDWGKSDPSDNGPSGPRAVVVKTPGTTRPELWLPVRGRRSTPRL